MKLKQLLTKTLLVVAMLGVGGSASWAETVSFVNRANTTVVTGASGTITTTSSGKYKLATADLTSVPNMSIAGIIQIEFDATVSSGTRWIFGIGDVATRGTNANGSSSSTYNTTGIITFFGTNNGSNFRINNFSSGTRNDNLFGESLHVTFVFNRIEKTYTCNIVDKSDASNKLSASGSTSIENANVVEVYSWVNSHTETVSDLTVTVTPAYSYTVNAVDGSSKFLKTIVSGKYLVGDPAIRIDYPQNILVGNTLYSIAMRASNPRFAQTITPDKDNYTVTLNYSGSSVTNVVRYVEAEDISGVSKGSNTSYASLNNMGYTSSNTTYKEVLTLPKGKYRIYARGVNGNSAARICNFKVADGDPVWSFSITGSNTNVTGNSEEFTVSTPSMLYFACDGSSASGCDWFYIKGTVDEGSDVTGLIVNADMETAGSGSGYQEYVKGWNNTDNVVNYRRLANSGVTDPNGAFTNTYSFENWTNAAGGLTGKMSQTINGLPNGVYRLQLAALVRTVNGQFVYGKSNGKTYKTTLSGDNETANDYEVIVAVEDNQLEIGLDMNDGGADWAAIDNARLTYAPYVSVTIGASGFATFSSPYALNFDDTDVTPYCASAAAGGEVTMTKLTGDIAANTGLFLKGDNGANTYVIPVVATAGSAPATNYLKPTTGENIYNGSKFQYVYANQSAGYAFYKVGSTLAPATGKAYLETETSAAGAGARMTIKFDDETTGISATLNDSGEMINDKVFYDLQGRKVVAPTKGLYIVNGKKVVVK